MTKATSLSDKTALRDEVVPRRVRQFGSARDGLRELRLQRLTAIAVIPLTVFRRVGLFARDLRPKNGSRLAFVASTSLGCKSSSFLRGSRMR